MSLLTLALAACLASGAVPDTLRVPADATVGTVELGDGWGPARTLMDVRTGYHEDFDRLVFEFTGPEPPHTLIEYADGPVERCGSGESVAAAGLPYLQVTFFSASAHTADGEPTVPFRRAEPYLPALHTVEDLCDFEGVVQWVALIDERRPYRAFVLREPARVVIDVYR